MAVPKLMKLQDVLSVTGGGTTSLYQDIRHELLPPPLKRGRSSFWVESEIAAISAARIGGASDDDIRQLVRRLMAARKVQAEAATGEALRELSGAHL